MRIRLAAAVAIFLCLPARSRALDCAPAYQAAANAYSSFIQSSEQKKSPENWEKLARQFQAVAEKYPACHKADDAWFTAGKLRFDGYQFSRNPDDLRSALSLFQTLLDRHPDSTLADDAQFFRGRCYELLGDPAQARIEYQSTIRRFRRGDMVRQAQARLTQPAQAIPPARPIAATSPSPASPVPAEPPAGATGPSPLPLQTASPTPPSNTPPSPTLNPASSPMLSPPVTAPTQAPAESENAPARLLTIRYWSSKDYTRVVIDLDREVAFVSPHLLKPDPALGSPPRLYMDFPGTALGQEFKQQTPFKAGFYDLPIGDGLLKKARVGQPQAGIVRVVLDLESIAGYHCFPLPGEEGGFRVVLDVSGQKTPPVAPEIKTASPKTPPAGPSPQPSSTAPAEIPSPAGTQPAAPLLPKTAAPSPAPAPTPPAPPAIPLKPKPIPSKSSPKYLIVIDAGHGGKDPGAIGPSRVREKDVTLALAKKLQARLLKENPEVKVILTRSDDRYLSLVERTARANTLDANLFISIHCNASPNRQAAGIETYYLNNTTDRAALKLAARENFVSEEKMNETGDLNFILADMATSSKVEGSVPLAGLIQESLVRELKKKYSGIIDLGVKKAPFWVLTGARMPCVLVEVSFLSHRKEEKRLASSAYQDDLARAMAMGVRHYLDEHPELAAAWGE